LIQDIAPFNYRVEYDVNAKACAGDYVLPFNGQNIGVIEEPALTETVPNIRFIKYEDLGCHETQLRYLFAIEDKSRKPARFFLPESQLIDSERPLGYTEKPTFIFHMLPERELAFAGITAHSLYLWYDTNRYCGKCGREFIHSDTERALTCTHCNIIRYPSIAPVVIVGVLNNGRILLTRYKNRQPGFYALVAGFVETGESLEACVRREVLEETGIHVKNIRYYKSQPWGFSCSLLSGFYCDVDGDDTIRVDDVELSEGVWLAPHEIEQRDTGIALTAEMIERFRTSPDACL